MLTVNNLWIMTRRGWRKLIVTWDGMPIGLLQGLGSGKAGKKKAKRH